MRFLYTLLIVLCIPGILLAEPILYKYVDENGVVSFTNKPENIPEASRDSIEAIEKSDLPPLMTMSPKTTDVTPSRPISWSWDRLKTPWMNFVIGLGLLTALSYIAVRVGAGGILLRVTGKFLLITFIGAAIYSIQMANEFRSRQTDTIPPSTKPHFKRLNPIERTMQSTEAFEKRMEEQEEILRSIE